MAYAMSSITFLAGKLGLTTSICGTSAIMMTGAKSLLTSKGSLLYRAGLITVVPEDPINSV